MGRPGKSVWWCLLSLREVLPLTLRHILPYEKRSQRALLTCHWVFYLFQSRSSHYILLSPWSAPPSVGLQRSVLCKCGKHNYPAKRVFMKALHPLPNPSGLNPNSSPPGLLASKLGSSAMPRPGRVCFLPAAYIAPAQNSRRACLGWRGLRQC